MVEINLPIKNTRHKHLKQYSIKAHSYPISSEQVSSLLNYHNHLRLSTSLNKQDEQVIQELETQIDGSLKTFKNAIVKIAGSCALDYTREPSQKQTIKNLKKELKNLYKQEPKSLMIKQAEGKKLTKIQNSILNCFVKATIETLKVSKGKQALKLLLNSRQVYKLLLQHQEDEKNKRNKKEKVLGEKKDKKIQKGKEEEKKNEKEKEKKNGKGKEKENGKEKEKEIEQEKENEKKNENEKEKEIKNKTEKEIEIEIFDEEEEEEEEEEEKEKKKKKKKGVEKEKKIFLVVKKWIEIEPMFEFRGFVKNNNLTAVTQRHTEVCFPELELYAKDISKTIRSFFKSSLQNLDFLSNNKDYIIDFFIYQKNLFDDFKITILGIDSFNKFKNPGLFNWVTDKNVLFGNAKYQFRFRMKPLQNPFEMLSDVWGKNIEKKLIPESVYGNLSKNIIIVVLLILLFIVFLLFILGVF
ncbi:cell division cycle protein [Anaeramoeba flamelloides]|uniref:Cell division cycle protein n=1 Tax=Anaeramoeba flamelloides TaxID=1746091 RepID=A0ABQ8YMB5_9EUKA|nr:cell division cycle protein [Anaeramoeba flamelloides]